MNGSDMETEEKLRAALARRAGSVQVGDPNTSLRQRIVALRHRRRQRMVIGSAVIAVVVAVVALAPVLTPSHNARRAADSTGSMPHGQPAVLTSKLVRDTHPSVPPGAVNALTNANTSTAIDLYHQLAAQPGNMFFSPYSISTALGMAAAGARGSTLSQMLAVLHDTLPAAEFQPATNALNLALLAPRRGPVAGAAGKALELELANSVWSQAGYHIEPAFLDLLARDYGAALNTLDFQGHAAAATDAINAWVAANTNNKIRKLFASLDPTTRFVLVNAVHFKASWQQPFLPASTRAGAFTTAAGTTVSVPFMHGELRTTEASGPGWQAVDLPYIGDASMTVIVPDAGTLPAFERSLDPALLAHIIGSLSASDVTFAFPKLQLTDNIDLVPELQALGMKDAFSNADFSGITGNRDLSISQVVHQATVTIDEGGTEAAAATGIAFAEALVRPTTLTVNRPYLFLIRDHLTGEVLFAGRVTDPTQTQVQQ